MKATTRELVTFVLERDADVREWWENHEGFTLDKARAAELDQYDTYTSAIIAEGVRSGLLAKGQVRCDEPL